MTIHTVAFIQASAGTIFGIAAVLKLRTTTSTTAAFLRALAVPGGASRYIAFVGAPVELALAIWLLSGSWRRAAAATAVLVSGCFLAAQALALIKRVNVRCGCLGDVTHHAGWAGPFLLATCLLTASLALCLALVSNPSLAQGSIWADVGRAATLGVLAGAGAVLTASLLDEILYFSANRMRPAELRSLLNRDRVSNAEEAST